MTERDPAAPIDEDMPKRFKLKLPKEDRLKDYRDKRSEDDYVPEPPTY